MQNNYYFLKKLAKELESSLIGLQLSTCFSQQKNELILGFSSLEKKFYIKATLQPDFSCLSFPNTFARSKRNSANLFSEIIDKKIESLVQYENERCFSIVFESHFTLLFKMHGNRSNIILFRKDKIVALFKNSLLNDKNILLQNLDRPLGQTQEEFIKNDGNYFPLFPTFGKIIKQYLKENNYESKNIVDQWLLISTVLKQLKSPNIYLSTTNEIAVLSLVKSDTTYATYQSPFKALNQFYYDFISVSQLSKEKGSVLKKLSTDEKRTFNYIHKTQKKLDDIKSGRKLSEIADIIMANLHAIANNINEVELFDFYKNQPLKIKLNKNITPQKNAENYYRKSKNRKLEIASLENNLQEKSKTLKTTQRQIIDISAFEDFKSLRSYLKNNGLTKVEKSTQTIAPYKKYSYLGFDILVGKNAKSNDILTQKHAWKDDLWLHARDVSGSHVVIKKQAGKEFPKPLIEKVAALAAYHSKRKTDSLCPVIYTPKKFVRKPKGSLPGQVVVEKEQVILVVPANF